MKRGFTVIELIIVVAIVGIIAALVFHGSGSWTAGTQAPSEARAWAQQMGIDVQGISCTEYDTDDDGYVSCTLSSKAPDGTTKLTAIECARDSTWNGNRGCKMQRPGGLRQP